MSEFTIFGRISDRASGKGISNLRVEAWDKDVKNDDFCGTAQTNKNGVYSVEFDESAFKDSKKDTLPDVYLKVFEGDKLLETTKVQKNVPAGETEINVEVGVSPASTKKSAPKSKSKAKTGAKATNSSAETQKVVPTVVEEQSSEEPKPAVLATGLEDYGRWKAMFKDHKSEEGKPFRRGRIWA